ncbi:hypothetical protein Hdeb2414_s0006g00207741 [Helianthus debilis subsp. tardiflorus]
MYKPYMAIFWVGMLKTYGTYKIYKCNHWLPMITNINLNYVFFSYLVISLSIRQEDLDHHVQASCHNIPCTHHIIII